MNVRACPRCDSKTTRQIADSPVKGAWQVFRCDDCNYVWRSSEEFSGIDRRIDYLRKTIARFWE